MPLRVGVKPPPIVVPPLPQVPRPVPNPGVYVPLWIAPDGTEWPMNPAGSTVGTLDAVTGLGIAPVDITADADPVGGTRVRHVQAQPRNITWPLRLRGVTHMAFLILWRAYAIAIAQTRRLGPGTLRITRPDGTSREIDAYYDGGWEQEPGQGWLEDTPIIAFYCPDPFWRDTVAHVVDLEYVAAADDFLDPYPMLSSGAALGEVALTNAGNVEAWPTWTLTGPATEFAAINNTTGEQFTVTYNLLAGETITITTRPGTITGPAGANLINALDWPDAELWRLVPGLNDIDLQVLGAAAGTTVRMSYLPRYETA